MKNVGKFIHMLYPFSFGILSFLFFLLLDKGYELRGIDDAISSVINFSSIIIGFYTAMYGILLTLKDSDLMQKFREDNLNTLFKNELYESLIISFGILISSIALQVIINYDKTFTLIFFYVWTFLLGYFISISFRTISLLVSIMFNNDRLKRDSTINDISEEERNAMIDKLKEK